MKKIIALLPLLLLALSSRSAAQNASFYYTFSNRKISITPVPGVYLAEFPNGLRTRTGPAGGSNTFAGARVTDKLYIVTDTSTTRNFGSPCYITPAYKTANGDPMYYSKDIVLKFKPAISVGAKNAILSDYGLTYVKSSASFDLYRVPGDALAACKLIYESGKVEFCTPDFIVKARPCGYIPNDPFFAKQWYLHNTGQGANDNKTTTPNADMDLPEAWDITKGSPNVTVAIIDAGVASDHFDLPNTRQKRLMGSNFAAPFEPGTDPNDPSPTLSTIIDDWAHGTACAGIVAATQDNNEGISGIAPQCDIMPVKIYLASDGTASSYAAAIDFADSSGADILSNSWSFDSDDPEFQPVVIYAIRNALAHNKTVLFAAGNEGQRQERFNGFVTFPGNANIRDMITVGASDRDDKVAFYSPDGVELKISAPSSTANNRRVTGEAGNIWTLDIPDSSYGYNSWRNPDIGFPAVGEMLPASGSNYTAYTGRFGATSAATAMAAGVAALMKSVNSCLGGGQIRDLLQVTADHIGGYNYNWNPSNPGHSMELGFGKINARKAVEAAQKMISSRLDLYLKDTWYDVGYDSGYAFTWGADQSPDIWARNQDDGLVNQQQENLAFHAGYPVYVYVHVSNKSCVESLGTEKLALYWSRAATNSSWPQNWDGTDSTKGDSIGVQTIPRLKPGASVILKFPWYIFPYSGVGNTWHDCLLARIENSVADPITVNPGHLEMDVTKSNNVSLRNCVVGKGGPKHPLGGGNPADAVDLTTDRFFYVGNSGSTPETFDLVFRTGDHERNPVTDVAEVKLQFDRLGWELIRPHLETPGAESVKIDPVEQSVTLSGKDYFEVRNIAFPANTRVPMKITFAFLAAQQSSKNVFEYHALQKYSAPDETGEHWTGGVHFEIHKPLRTGFRADAGPDQAVDKGAVVTLNAKPIGEAATYTWYDAAGMKVGSGTQLVVTPTATQSYKLEVVADSDGSKDYDAATVVVRGNYITGLTPNPATSQVTVSYSATNATSVSLLITGVNTLNNNHSYALNCADSRVAINTSEYQAGIYLVSLICDGVVVGTKQLQIR